MRKFTVVFATAIIMIATVATSLDGTASAADFDFTIDPELDISRFLPYKIYVENIPDDGNVQSVDLVVNTINGNGGGETCWDYYVDGACDSSPVSFSLTRNIPESRWESSNIYPDAIYPEVFFASSPLTWYNVPSETPIYREAYALLKFDNPFTMVADMSFWLEFNALPNASNSADLEVYLCDDTTSLPTFHSDWRDSAHVESVGTLDKDATFHHSHTANSSHHLVSLQTNADGTVGTKSLDISDGYWVILYSKSPSIQRGWTLRYHPSSRCTHDNRWYMGSRFGWTTAETAGCPDAHTHQARRSDNLDGVHAVATAHYSGGGTATDEADFYFGTLPNLAPNGTSFTYPYRGGAYAGTIDVEWDPASDANNDTLTYTIDLLDADEIFVQNLVTDTVNTSVSFDTTTVDDGTYHLKGTVCDDDDPALCTEFLTDTLFYVLNEGEITTLTHITIGSDNPRETYAKAGDTVTLEFESDSTLDAPTIDLFSGGYKLHNEPVVTEVSANTWKVTASITSQDTDGRLSFDIISGNLDQIYDDTTDSSVVTVDVTPPSFPANLLAGRVVTAGSVIRVETGRPLFSGNTEPRSDIGISIHSDPISGTTIADQEGNWSWRPETVIPDGEHRVVLTVTDQAGNEYEGEFTLVVEALADTGTAAVLAGGVGVGMIGVTSVTFLSRKRRDLAES